MKRVFVGYAAICQQTSRANVACKEIQHEGAYACAQAATLIMNNQAFNFAKTDGRKWLAVLNLVQLYSHAATVLGLKPSMALIRASIWLIRRHRKSSNVTSSKISLPGSSPSGPRCGRDVIRHEDRNGNECDRAHHKFKGAHSLQQAAGIAPNGRRFSRVEMAISQRSSLAASSRLEGIGDSLAR